MSKDKNVTSFKLTAEDDARIFAQANELANKYDQSVASILRNAIRAGLRQMKEAEEK